MRLLDVERVIVAFSNEPHEETLELIRSMKDLEVQVDVVPRLFELVGAGVGIHTVEGLPLIGFHRRALSPSSRLLKAESSTWSFRICCAGRSCSSSSLHRAAIKLDSPGPVFFRQVRMGRSRTDLSDLQVPNDGR